MTDTQTGKSPLARLVLFLICLAIFGSAVAGAHYYTVDLPQQSLKPPSNDCRMDEKCFDDCARQGWGFFCITACAKCN